MTDTMREAPTAAYATTERPPLRRPREGRRRAAHSVPPVEPTTGSVLTAALGGPPLTGSTPVVEELTSPVPPARPAATPPAGTGPLRGLLGPVTGSLRLGRGRVDASVEQRLRVDWPQCKAHGLCAEIAPEVIQLDEWGYPIFDAAALSPEDAATARKAVQVCPTLALRLVEAQNRG